MEKQTENNDYSIKITKRVKLLEVNNDKCHNYYYLIHGKILNHDGTRCRKFRFVVWFDNEDIGEYFNVDYYKEKHVKEYLDECIMANCIMINHDNDTAYFYDICRESIKKYNNLVA